MHYITCFWQFFWKTIEVTFLGYKSFNILLAGLVYDNVKLVVEFREWLEEKAKSDHPEVSVCPKMNEGDPEEDGAQKPSNRLLYRLLFFSGFYVFTSIVTAFWGGPPQTSFKLTHGEIIPLTFPSKNLEATGGPTDTEYLIWIQPKVSLKY